jgi:3-hydroxyisobutyrate dehydrogenase-like beta-hydroxyacid dehydrogenase
MSNEVPGLGWLGTGRMGAALAGRLIDAGQPVTVWNRTPAKTGPLVARGARAVGRVTGLSGCDIVFVTVSASHDLEEVVAELLGGESRPGVIVDCSTVSAAASARSSPPSASGCGTRISCRSTISRPAAPG